LKKCLGDSDGDSTNNVEVYNWDYGTHLNPHLIKLVDATQYYPNYVADIDETSCDNECQMDNMLKKYPSSPLCTNSAGNAAKFGSDAHSIGWCSNLNSPGFFAALVYDAVTYSANPFRLFTRAAHDYATTTQFFVFTTMGYLNMVNPRVSAFTRFPDATYTTAAKVASYYTNTLHLSNSSTGKAFGSIFDGYRGNIDCETNAIGQNGARDCVNKNDYVMIFGTSNTGLSDAVNLASNPVYPNIYQVKKIFRNEKSWKGHPVDANSEVIRNQIVLDYAINADYVWHGGNATALVDTSAQVYKFHPSTANSDGGYRYVAQCSNRGICNTDTGICECFHGYTSDNCGTINALAQ